VYDNEEDVQKDLLVDHQFGKPKPQAFCQYVLLVISSTNHRRAIML
jgi:hypothetical protein